MQPDYFELLSLPRGTEIDEAKLTRNYFAAQMKYHPDRNKDGAEMSARLNDAYNTLKNRYSRLEYLLGDIKLEACAALLEEMLELREDPEAGVPKAKAEVERLYNDSAELYKSKQIDKMAQNFVRIKYLNRFLTDVAANS